jgi:hypothetical protein
MKAMAWVCMAAIGMTAEAFAAEKKPDDIAAIRAELKPLRQKAYQEPAVKAAREKLDAAYRAYWQAVRTAMLRLDPSKTALIEKDMQSRESAPSVAKTAK